MVLKTGGDDNRSMLFSDLSSVGRNEVHDEGNPGAGSGYSEICLKCWESKASVRNVNSDRATSTFSKHQSCNERFILWLYENRSEYVMDELRLKLDDVKAEVDYSAVVAQFNRYRKNGGQKSLAQRKEDYKVALLRNTISESLITPGGYTCLNVHIRL